MFHPCPQNHISYGLLLLLARSIFFNEIYHTISLINVVIKHQIEIDRIYIFSAIQVQNTVTFQIAQNILPS